jgi:cell division protein ZapA
MDDRSLTLDVSILGHEYRVACKESEREELLQAVQFLDRRMREIRDGGKVVGSERIAVMAALNIAHEFLTMKLGNGFDIGQAKRRISQIEAKLDAAIAQQDKLF